MYDYALIGSPNTGKTTIFNALTHSNEKTGNYQGVTVTEKTAYIKELKSKLVDLPGIYLLSSYSLEEKVSEDYIKNNKNSIFLNIIEAGNLKRGITLTKSLIEKGLKVILVLTFFDEFLRYGGKIDVLSLSKTLKIPVIAINGEDRKDIKKLKELMKKTDRLTPTVWNKNFSFDNIFFPPVYKETKLDKLLFNKFFCALSFIVIMIFVFCLTFLKNSLGDLCSKLTEKLLDILYNVIKNFLISKNCPVILESFICEGIFKGIFSVVTFVPQLAILYFFISLMNESGYVSRIAFMFDGIFKKIGLNGRAVFSYIMGLGCTAVAELSTKSLDNKKMQKKTALCLPFVSCSARLPIYMVILNTYFLRYRVFLLISVYFSGIIISVLVSAFLNKFIYKEEQTFIMELPNLRFPKFRKILKILTNFMAEFIVKIGGVIIIVMCSLWALSNFNFRLKFLNGLSTDTSILYYIGNGIKYIFYPIGIKDWKVAVSVICGMFAKEAVVGSLSQFYPDSLPFNTLQALCFLTFCGLYTPCLSALSIMKKEIGIKLTVISALFQFLLALVIAFIVNLLGEVSMKINIIVILSLLVATILILVKVVFKKNKCSDCLKCKKCYERVHSK